MKVSLIGGSGFVGTRLIDLLRSDDSYELQNVDKLQSHFFPDVTVIGDVRDRCRGIAGAEHRDDVSPLSLCHVVNVGGRQNTLATMKANGVKRVVFT